MRYLVKKVAFDQSLSLYLFKKWKHPRNSRVTEKIIQKIIRDRNAKDEERKERCSAEPKIIGWCSGEREREEVGSKRGCHQSSLALKGSRGGTKIIFPDKNGQLLPGKGDPCVGHPIARISAVVRPVLFFQVLFLFDCRLSFSFSLSLLLLFTFLFQSSRPLVSRCHGPPDCRRQLRLVLWLLQRVALSQTNSIVAVLMVVLREFHQWNSSWMYFRN